MTNLRIALVTTSAAALLAMAGCGSAEPATPAPPPVALAAPPESPAPEPAEEANAAPSVLRTTGTAEAIRSANLAPATTAPIVGVDVEEGDHVREGQVLVRLDSRAARANAAQARAGAAAARAQAAQASADLDRLAPLAERGTIAPSRLTQLRTQQAAAEAQSEAASAAASAAGAMARNATVRAPFDGIVVDLPIEVGELAAMMPATTVARVVDLSALLVRARLHERALGSVAVGDVVRTTFPSLGRTVEGRVIRIGREVSATSRTFEVVVQIDNADETLPSGLFAELEFGASAPARSVAAPNAAGEAGASLAQVAAPAEESVQ